MLPAFNAESLPPNGARQRGLMMSLPSASCSQNSRGAAANKFAQAYQRMLGFRCVLLREQVRSKHFIVNACFMDAQTFQRIMLDPHERHRTADVVIGVGQQN